MLGKNGYILFLAKTLIIAGIRECWNDIENDKPGCLIKTNVSFSEP